MNSFMDKLRNFLGIQPEPPRNDFRNPIWGSDDDDDGDELYTKHAMDVYEDPIEMQREFSKQMHEMFKSFGSIFGDIKVFFRDDHFEAFPDMGESHIESENYNSNSIRDYYLKPGYHSRKHEHHKEDIDLDGKISSHEMSGLLKQKENNSNVIPARPFSGNLVPGRPFCQTIITTSVKNPDGSVETRRIVKNGHDVIEETTTTTGPDTDFKGPLNPGVDPSATGHIYSAVLSDLGSLFRNFNL